MNFEHLTFLPWIVLGFSLFLLVVVWLERKFFTTVKLYWFYDRSILSYLSTAFFLIGMGLLLVSLLDFRGAEEKVKAGVPTERTIILIDTSASMLAEDIRPSRLNKAILVAKHFARKATGHQISIVAFAEIQKKIVPFTHDIDLIDARLDSIKNLRNQNGSSALTTAIQESVQYFKETGEARGNILVLTDGEETASDIKLSIPKEVRLALVGIGTKQGGRIPLDDGRGFRFGYKKNRGKDVITKLEEEFFKKVVSDTPAGKYWIANTYTLPSDEILDFFSEGKGVSDKEQDMIIRPVLMQWLVVPAVILLILSYLSKMIRIFSLGILVVMLPAFGNGPDYSPELLKKLEQLQKGNLSQLEKIKLADDLQKAGAQNESLALYEENLPINQIDNVIPPEAYLNYGTGLLEKGEGQKGLAVYESLLSSMDSNSAQSEKIKEMIEKNVMNYFQVQEQKEKQNKKDKDKDNKDQDNDQQGSGSKQDKSQKNDKGQDQRDTDQKGDKQDSEDKDEDGDKKEDQIDNGNEDQNEDKKKNEPNEGEEKKLPPPKLQPKLKQLLSDDRQLQMKIIEQSTRDMNRRKSRENKDW